MDNSKLLEQVKRKLNITWDDEDTTARLNDIITSAIPDLKHKLGIVDDNFDFSVPGSINTLFLSYCLYEWNHALEEFDVNYARMIAQIRTKLEVEAYLDEVIADEV